MFIARISHIPARMKCECVNIVALAVSYQMIMLAAHASRYT